MQPGDTINPGGSVTEPPTQPMQPPQAPPPDVPKQPISQPTVPEEPVSQWAFKDDTGEQSGVPIPPTTIETIEWTASEYIAHDKSPGWFLFLALAVIGFAGVVYLVTQEVVSSVVIVVMGIAFGVFAARQPQELHYSLSSVALRVGAKVYSYAQFKSFTIVDEGPIRSISLMPLQRFMPPLSVYYAPEDEEKIADALSLYLPYEDRKQDMVDRVMRKVRF